MALRDMKNGTGPAAFGWYGKMPALGDFLRDGLSPTFITAWDRWLQGLMIAGGEALGDTWLDCYMGAPIWRFALSPGLCGPRGAAGVVMPSVDRVGRQFPLCLAMETDTAAWASYARLAPVFPALEEVALSMLEDGATLEALRQQLSDLVASLPPSAADGTQFDGQEDDEIRPQAIQLGDGWVLESAGSEEAALAALAAIDPALSPPLSLWVAPLGDRHRILGVPGMPTGADMARALFDINAPVWAQTSLHGSGSRR